jgi:hypothetical protein
MELAGYRNTLHSLHAYMNSTPEDVGVALRPTEVAAQAQLLRGTGYEDPGIPVEMRSTPFASTAEEFPLPVGC